MSIAAILDYRTPLRKLLQFFVRSRDKWKAKCQAAKRENKSLKIRLDKMRESRDRWKTRAQSAEKAAKVASAPKAAKVAPARPVRETKNRSCRLVRGPGLRDARVDLGA